MLETAAAVTQILLAVGALCAVYRVYRGPSVLDRVISVDVILIIVASIMLTEMVRSDHQDFILFVLVTSVIGFLGAVAIAAMWWAENRRTPPRRPSVRPRRPGWGSRRPPSMPVPTR